jgi:predicted permease
MRRLRALALRVAGMFGRTRSDADIDDEIRLHVEMLAEDHRRAGLDPAEADRAARAACGSLASAAEAYRDRRGLPALETVWRDVTYGLRLLAKTPAFTAAAVLSLALGIGANTTILQLLDAVSFRGLPVAAPNELVQIRVHGDGRWGRQSGRNRQVSAPMWWYFRDHQTTFSGTFAFGDTRFNLAPTGEIRYVEGLWVSGSFFPVLGVRPALGRLFEPDDDRPGCGYFGAVISHQLWQRQFGGRPDAIGAMLHIGRENVPVIGVTPAAFFGVEVGRRFEVALPLCSSGFELRNHFWLAMMGRRPGGTSLARANEQLASLGRGLLEQTLPPGYRPDLAKRYLDLRFEAADGLAGVSPLRSEYERPLWVLMAIAVCVLLIAATNLANLMLARASARAPEFALRLALGGSRARLIQQVAIEAALLAAAGAAFGVLAARWSAALLVLSIGTAVDRIYLDLRLDWRIIAAAAAAATVTALLFGLAPAIRAASAPGLMPLSNRGTASASGRLGMRKTLVAVQLGLSFVLVFAAGLFARSFQNLTTGESGFRSDAVLVSHVFFPETDLPQERRRAFYRDLLDRLRAMPGTQAIASSFGPPLSGQYWNSDLKIQGVLVGLTDVNAISPDYFRAIGATLVAGRDFTDADTEATSRVAIVTTAFAKHYLSGGSVIGRSIVLVGEDGEPDTSMEIVGLVQDTRYHSLQEAFQPIVYTPQAQDLVPSLTRRYVIRSTRQPDELRRSVAAIVSEASPGASLRFEELKEAVREATLRERLIAGLSTSFGLLALILAAIGTYGVTAYGVVRRQPEIGLRIALGATRSQVVAMVLWEIARIVAVGLCAGVAIALVVSRAAQGLLVGLEPTDGWTLSAALAVNVLVALVATLLPAYRAARISPIVALRAH